MLAEYRAPLDAFGAWFYRRLHCGRRMTLKPEMVAAVFMEGRLVWGRPIGGG